jgi:tetratricopeptide (TPR) repeat protein
MKIQRGLALALAVALAASTFARDDAAAQRGRGRGRGAAAQLPQVGCPGAQPSDQAVKAQEALTRTLITQGAQKQDYLQDALEQSTAGVAAAANNPYHHLLRGQALLGLAGEFHGQQAGPEYTAVFPQGTTINAGDAIREAVTSLNRAVELCQEMAGAVTEARTQSAAVTFALGHQRFQAADTTGAIELWRAVTQLDTANTDAHFNLGVLASQRGDVATATTSYMRVLTMTQPADSAAAEQRSVALGGLVNAGARLFNENKFQEAAQAFMQVTVLDPGNRDAWYNHALALYKLQRWRELIPVATRAVQLDPLNYNAQIVLFNAYKELSDAAKAQNNAAVETENRNLALRTLEAADALPVHLGEVTFETAQGSVTVKGTVTGAAAAAGTPVQIEFTLTSPAGEVGKGTVTVTAPAKDQNAPFQVTIPTTGIPTSYRYRLVR